MSIKEREVLDFAWKYFQQHAQQRISFFNFFVILSGLMTTALMTTFQETFKAHIVGAGIGLMLSLISFVFWKVDNRNKFLTRIGEEAIKELESNYQLEANYKHFDRIKIFSHEEEKTNDLKSHKWWKFVTKQYSLGQLFNFIFLVFFLVGLLGAGFSIYYEVQSINSKTAVEEKIDEINKKLDTLDFRVKELKDYIYQ